MANNQEIREKKIFFSQVDSVLRYLRNIRKQPVTVQISIGVGSGSLVGFVFAKTSRITAIALGCSIIILQFCNYRGYLKFNRTQIQRDFDEFKNNIKSQVGLEKSVVPTTKELDDFLTKNGYLFAGFIAGMLIGFGLG